MKRFQHEMMDGGLIKHSFLYNGRAVSITCEQHSRIDQSIRAGHWYEHKMLGHITRTARAGVFLDIGGNVGHHSVYFSLFCPSTQVVCFEPLPEHVRLIKTNIANNSLENKIIVRPHGAAAEIQSFEMTTNAANYQRRITGLCMPIDDSQYGGPISVIKIDVEGMEINVLNGLKKTITNYAPDIYIECLTQSQLEQVQCILSSYGYIRDEVDIGLGLTYKFKKIG